MARAVCDQASDELGIVGEVLRAGFCHEVAAVSLTSMANMRTTSIDVAVL
jgi:hypothetical protein